DRLTGLKTFWHYFSVNRGAVIGLFVFILLVLAALSAPLLAPYAPDVQDKTAFLRPPAWQQGGSTQYLLGTDPVGRDILSRLLYGARFSLLIGAVVVTLALTGGITLGLLAGS
ncbi:dipeptide ABC transporter permease DppC, partial [Mesorhizobium sp. M8A.F.Ca.ET.142.01.1.1]